MINAPQRSLVGRKSYLLNCIRRTKRWPTIDSTCWHSHITHKQCDRAILTIWYAIIIWLQYRCGEASAGTHTKHSGIQSAPYHDRRDTWNSSLGWLARYRLYENNFTPKFLKLLGVAKTNNAAPIDAGSIRRTPDRSGDCEEARRKNTMVKSSRSAKCLDNSKWKNSI